MESKKRATGEDDLCLTPFPASSATLRLRGESPPDTGAPSGTRPSPPMRASLPPVVESSPASRKSEGPHCFQTSGLVCQAVKAGWEKLTRALDAAQEHLTDFPELSPELIECLQKDTVPHLRLYWTALVVCFAPLLSLIVFTIPIPGPIDVPAWQWLPVLFLIAFQCAFLLAPWSNSFLSDVWGEERVAKYFKIGLMAGAWQLLCLGVLPAFTPYFPLPWMPMIGGVTLLATIVMIYYNVPRDKRSLRSKRKLAMLFMTVGSGVTVFALSYPFLYYISLELHGFLKLWIFLFFFVFRIIYEKVAKHYARLYCVDCYPMIVLFAMYAYEFFISSVISGVTEVWLAILLISLDLMENLYYIYCIYQARNSISWLQSINSFLSQSRSINGHREIVSNGAQGGMADLATLSPTQTIHPAGGVRAAEMSGYDHYTRTARSLPHSPVLESKSWLSDLGEGVTESLRGEGRQASSETLFNAVRCNSQTDSGVLSREQNNSHFKVFTKAGRFKDRGSNFSRVMPSMNGSADETSDHRVTPRTSRQQQGVKAKVAGSDAPMKISRRGSSMSTLASFTSLSKNPSSSVRRGTATISSQVEGPSVTEGCRTSAGRSREGSFISSRRSSVLEVITDLVTGRNTGKIGEGDENSERALSIMTIAICKELVEVLAPIQYLICFVVLRSLNPKLHDTFWDMPDEEFVRGIWRLLFEIAAEACVFVLLIIVIKRRLSDSVIFIALRLGHHFLWPFLTVQLSMMTYYIVLQYSNAGMVFSLDVKWIGEKNTTWHGGNCYTNGNETIEEVC